MKSNIAILLLGVWLAWSGLPKTLHLFYWSLIGLSFVLGHKIHF